jgi:hypothetical protein
LAKGKSFLDVNGASANHQSQQIFAANVTMGKDSGGFCEAQTPWETHQAKDRRFTLEHLARAAPRTFINLELYTQACV